MNEITAIKFSENKLRGYCHVKNRKVQRSSEAFQRFMNRLSDDSNPSKSHVFFKVGLVIFLSAIGAITLDYLLS